MSDTSPHTSEHQTGSSAADGSPARPNAESGRLGRIAGETRGLFEDLKEWVELRIRLLQMDVEERIQRAANQAVVTSIAIVLALFGLLFALTAGALALGDWMGSRSLGFLIVAAALGLIALGLYKGRPNLVDTRDRGSAARDDRRLQKSAPAGHLPEHSNDTGEEEGRS